MKRIKTTIYYLFLFSLIVQLLPLKVYSNEYIEAQSSSLIKGYISNKSFQPLKLKVFKIEDDFSAFTDRNLEDNTLVPKINMKLIAESVEDYFITINEEKIFIPKSTQFSGYISEITPPKKFNRRGLFKVVFDHAVCPGGKNLYLKSMITSSSHATVYNPFSHLGKTTLNLLGGSLAGALFSYQLGGIGLIAATHGYSLACGAAAGGFIGTLSGAVTSGKEASIEPGTELLVLPVDEVSLKQMGQVACKMPDINAQIVNEEINKSVDVEILSTKRKNDLLGEYLLSIVAKIKNNSNEKYNLNNFYLRDSQGKEYSVTFADLDDDLLENLEPNETKTVKLHFYVDHPKASHWLILKNKTLSGDIGKWEININS